MENYKQAIEKLIAERKINRGQVRTEKIGQFKSETKITLKLEMLEGTIRISKYDSEQSIRSKLLPIISKNKSLLFHLTNCRLDL
jgi:hypothetical protein